MYKFERFVHLFLDEISKRFYFSTEFIFLFMLGCRELFLVVVIYIKYSRKHTSFLV